MPCDQQIFLQKIGKQKKKAKDKRDWPRRAWPRDKPKIKSWLMGCQHKWKQQHFPGTTGLQFYFQARWVMTWPSDGSGGGCAVAHWGCLQRCRVWNSRVNKNKRGVPSKDWGCMTTEATQQITLLFQPKLQNVEHISAIAAGENILEQPKSSPNQGYENVERDKTTITMNWNKKAN